MKTLIIRCAVFAMLALASGCKVSKDAELSDMHLPENYRGAELSDTLGIAKMPYSSFFTDHILRELIDTAIINNNDLQIALKNIESARLVYNQSKLGNLPALNVSLLASGSRPSDNSLNGLSLSQFLGSKHIEDYTASVGLSWEADIWSKIKNRKTAALSSFLQTVEARRTIQTALISNISKGYYNLMMLDTQLAIAKKISS